ncbi:hypothetical protein LB507_006733, partial [Fusarium sp. FIESC RH6]
ILLDISDEMKILKRIFEECDMALGPISPLVERSKRICWRKEHDLFVLLKKITGTEKNILWRAILYATKEKELMGLFNSYRHSVLLLRDLASTMAMAQVLSEIKEEGTDAAAGGNPATTPSNPTKRKAQAAFAAGVQELMDNDFTRSLVIIIQNKDEDGILIPKFVPVRSKYDSGSDENFVSAEILNKSGIDQTLITTIPQENQKERELHMFENFTFIPKQEVRLSWHKHNDMKQREDLFIVVEEAPFDVLICSKQWKVDSVRTGLFLFGRNKSKAEKREQKERAEQEERDAQAMITEQLKAAERRAAQG